MIILGIDPGSRITGFGLIDNHADRMEYIHSGSVKVKGDGLPQRLGFIYSEIETIIQQYRPQQMSIENVFMARNADSALKLGQARGAAICAGYQAGLEIAEYGIWCWQSIFLMQGNPCETGCPQRPKDLKMLSI